MSDIVHAAVLCAGIAATCGVGIALEARGYPPRRPTRTHVRLVAPPYDWARE